MKKEKFQELLDFCVIIDYKWNENNCIVNDLEDYYEEIYSQDTIDAYTELKNFLNKKCHKHFFDEYVECFQFNDFTVEFIPNYED